MADVSGLRRHSKVVKVAEIVAREVERELKQTAPVDSGELRRLITTEVRKTVARTRVEFRSGAPYAEFVTEHREEWDATMRRLPDIIARAWRSVASGTGQNWH